ncbi:MAG: hypothetical protein ACI9G5_000470 [Paracoccaceae bacterium]|jgi:hypothetical protein
MREVMRRNDKWLWRKCRRFSGELRDLAAKYYGQLFTLPFAIAGGSGMLC